MARLREKATKNEAHNIFLKGRVQKKIKNNYGKFHIGS